MEISGLENLSQESAGDRFQETGSSDTPQTGNNTESDPSDVPVAADNWPEDLNNTQSNESLPSNLPTSTSETPVAANNEKANVAKANPVTQPVGQEEQKIIETIAITDNPDTAIENIAGVANESEPPITISPRDRWKKADQNDQVLQQPDANQLAEKQRQAGLAEIEQINDITLVGEEHIRTFIDQQNEEHFEQVLALSEIIVIEHDSLTNNPYSTSSPQKRFMQEAQEHALVSGKQLHILDTELGTDLNDKYALIEQQNSGLSQEEYAYMISVASLLQGFLSGVPIQDLDRNIKSRLSNFIKNNEQVSAVVNEAVSQFTQALQDPARLKEFQSVVASFASIDSASRESAYQQKISEIKIANPNKKVALVVGKAHLKPIARSLTEPYITPANTNSIDQMRRSRNSLRVTIAA